LALPPTGSSRRGSLTASAARLGEPESEVARLQRQGWQAQALYYAKTVPELSFASTFYAKMMRNLRIFPAILEADGKPRRIEDDLPVRLLNRIQDPGGGIDSILGSYGTLALVTGEGQLFGRFLDTEREEWRFIWNDELQVDMGGPDGQPRSITWIPSYQTEPMTYEWGTEAVSYRFWTPDPGRSGEAWSPMRSTLQVAAELVALTDAVMATATSRITQGMLIVPQGMAPPPAEGGSDEDPLMDILDEDLTEHIRSAKENAGTPEAASPFVFSGDYDQLDEIRWLQLHDSQTDYAERELRREAVERLAQGLDMPKEVLTGVGQTNHWAAKQIMDDRWRSHGSAIGQQFCNDLNQAYYRPALREAGWADWQRTVIGMDDSAIIMPADMIDAVQEAIKMVAVGRPGARKLLNIPEEYAPDAKEEQFLLDLFTRKPLASAGGEVATGPSAQPPSPGSEGDSGRGTRVTASAELNGDHGRERGAAEFALVRCRELAGNRIRNRDRTCAAGVAAPLVAAHVGQKRLDDLGLVPRDLVKGGTELLRDLLADMGYQEAHISAFCDTIEALATKTLFEERVSLPPNLAANLALVRAA
jgi:hypothetical protein